MPGYELLTLHSAEDLAALADEWNALALRCPGYLLSQTFQWAFTAWAIISRPLGRELNCVTLRSGGRLVAVWPLVVDRDHGLRTLHPLGFEVREYCAPLVEPGDEARNWTALLWRAAARFADLAVLARVHAASPLAAILTDGNHWGVCHGATPAPYVAHGDYPDWAAYHAAISANLRRQLGRRQRRLAERGQVTACRVPASGCAAMIDWMLEHKRRWLARSNLTSDWIDRPDCRDFLVALTAREDATGGIAVFALEVDGIPIAGRLVSADHSRVEGFLSAYDLQWSIYSPGSLLTDYVMQWAFERGLDFDFRHGDQPHKYKWAKKSNVVINWHIATSLRGVPAVARLRAAVFLSRTREALALGRFVPRRWRRRSKTMLHRTNLSAPL